MSVCGTEDVDRCNLNTEFVGSLDVGFGIGVQYSTVLSLEQSASQQLTIGFVEPIIHSAATVLNEHYCLAALR